MTPAAFAALDRLHGYAADVRLAAANLRDGAPPGPPARFIRARLALMDAALAEYERAMAETASPARLPGDHCGDDTPGAA